LIETIDPGKLFLQSCLTGQVDKNQLKGMVIYESFIISLCLRATQKL
jgi:hypothetical protein